ncbi:hypothetical protein BB560_001354 [Smittium megazygosporum]|uniref:Spt20-like SEP domain-containing protein n=1 Tax=Smittium megazygosporum TaxID=133381 RepID=A0A2T9ZHT7_9FUNG|nr:hypothetical protein BB560_001354 [Smittium megazygosporum]
MNSDNLGPTSYFSDSLSDDFLQETLNSVLNETSNETEKTSKNANSDSEEINFDFDEILSKDSDDSSEFEIQDEILSESFGGNTSSVIKPIPSIQISPTNSKNDNSNNNPNNSKSINIEAVSQNPINGNIHSDSALSENGLNSNISYFSDSSDDFEDVELDIIENLVPTEKGNQIKNSALTENRDSIQSNDSMKPSLDSKGDKLAFPDNNLVPEREGNNNMIQETQIDKSVSSTLNSVSPTQKNTNILTKNLLADEIRLTSEDLINQLPIKSQPLRKKRPLYELGDISFLERYKDSPPSFKVFLYDGYFKFQNQDGTLPYNEFTQFFFDSLNSGEIPVELLNIINNTDFPYYEGCLIVEVHDHRKTSPVEIFDFFGVDQHQIKMDNLPGAKGDLLLYIPKESSEEHKYDTFKRIKSTMSQLKSKLNNSNLKNQNQVLFSKSQIYFFDNNPEENKRVFRKVMHPTEVTFDLELRILQRNARLGTPQVEQIHSKILTKLYPDLDLDPKSQGFQQENIINYINKEHFIPHERNVYNHVEMQEQISEHLERQKMFNSKEEKKQNVETLYKLFDTIMHVKKKLKESLEKTLDMVLKEINAKFLASQPSQNQEPSTPTTVSKKSQKKNKKSATSFRAQVLPEKTVEIRIVRFARSSNTIPCYITLAFYKDPPLSKGTKCVFMKGVKPDSSAGGNLYEVSFQSDEEVEMYIRGISSWYKIENLVMVSDSKPKIKERSVSESLSSVPEKQGVAILSELTGVTPSSLEQAASKVAGQKAVLDKNTNLVEPIIGAEPIDKAKKNSATLEPSKPLAVQGIDDKSASVNLSTSSDVVDEEPLRVLKEKALKAKRKSVVETEKVSKIPKTSKNSKLFAKERKSKNKKLEVPQESTSLAVDEASTPNLTITPLPVVNTGKQTQRKRSTTVGKSRKKSAQISQPEVVKSPALDLKGNSTPKAAASINTKPNTPNPSSNNTLLTQQLANSPQLIQSHGVNLPGSVSGLSIEQMKSLQNAGLRAQQAVAQPPSGRPENLQALAGMQIPAQTNLEMFKANPQNRPAFTSANSENTAIPPTQHPVPESSTMADSQYARALKIQQLQKLQSNLSAQERAVFAQYLSELMKTRLNQGKTKEEIEMELFHSPEVRDFIKNRMVLLKRAQAQSQLMKEQGSLPLTNPTTVNATDPTQAKLHGVNTANLVNQIQSQTGGNNVVNQIHSGNQHQIPTMVAKTGITGLGEQPAAHTNQQSNITRNPVPNQATAPAQTANPTNRESTPTQNLGNAEFLLSIPNIDNLNAKGQIVAFARLYNVNINALNENAKKELVARAQNGTLLMLLKRRQMMVRQQREVSGHMQNKASSEVQNKTPGAVSVSTVPSKPPSAQLVDSSHIMQGLNKNFNLGKTVVGESKSTQPHNTPKLTTEAPHFVSPNIERSVQGVVNANAIQRVASQLQAGGNPQQQKIDYSGLLSRQRAQQNLFGSPNTFMQNQATLTNNSTPNTATNTTLDTNQILKALQTPMLAGKNVVSVPTNTNPRLAQAANKGSNELDTKDNGVALNQNLNNTMQQSQIPVPAANSAALSGQPSFDMQKEQNLLKLAHLVVTNNLPPHIAAKYSKEYLQKIGANYHLLLLRQQQQQKYLQMKQAALANQQNAGVANQQFSNANANIPTPQKVTTPNFFNRAMQSQQSPAPTATQANVFQNQLSHMQNNPSVGAAQNQFMNTQNVLSQLSAQNFVNQRQLANAQNLLFKNALNNSNLAQFQNAGDSSKREPNANMAGSLSNQALNMDNAGNMTLNFDNSAAQQAAQMKAMSNEFLSPKINRTVNPPGGITRSENVMPPNSTGIPNANMGMRVNRMDPAISQLAQQHLLSQLAAKLCSKASASGRFNTAGTCRDTKRESSSGEFDEFNKSISGSKSRTLFTEIQPNGSSASKSSSIRHSSPKH